MTFRYLLDSDHVGWLTHDSQGRAGKRLLESGVDRICTSIIVAAELRFGAAKRATLDLLRYTEDVLARLSVQPFAAPADSIYGELRAELERRGKPIGSNDMLIAAHALALGCVLVTGNVREFSRVRNLQTESWIA
jgi:tRNA(fMet)-specific endonuclease VapC